MSSRGGRREVLFGLSLRRVLVRDQTQRLSLSFRRLLRRRVRPARRHRRLDPPAPPVR